MQSGIASRAIGLGSRLGWVWAGRLASRWMKSLHHHHDGICEITQWNTMSSELCTMALLICCKLFYTEGPRPTKILELEKTILRQIGVSRTVGGPLLIQKYPTRA